MDPIPLHMIRISRDHIIKIKIPDDRSLLYPKISEHQEIKLVWPYEKKVLKVSQN
jgi:hypothetical protein